MSKRLQIRRDTEANWQSVNPVLLQGEIGFVLDDNGNVVGKKVGNGRTAWDELEFHQFGSGGGVTIVESVDALDPDAPQGSLATVAVNTLREIKWSEVYQPTEEDRNKPFEEIVGKLTRISKFEVTPPESMDIMPSEDDWYMINFGSKDSGGVFSIARYGVQCMINGFDEAMMWASLDDGGNYNWEVYRNFVQQANELLSKDSMYYVGSFLNDEPVSLPSFLDDILHIYTGEVSTELYIKTDKGWTPYKESDTVYIDYIALDEYDMVDFYEEDMWYYEIPIDEFSKVSQGVPFDELSKYKFVAFDGYVEPLMNDGSWYYTPQYIYGENEILYGQHLEIFVEGEYVYVGDYISYMVEMPCKIYDNVEYLPEDAREGTVASVLTEGVPTLKGIGVLNDGDIAPLIQIGEPKASELSEFPDATLTFRTNGGSPMSFSIKINYYGGKVRIFHQPYGAGSGDQTLAVYDISQEMYTEFSDSVLSEINNKLLYGQYGGYRYVYVRPSAGLDIINQFIKIEGETYGTALYVKNGTGWEPYPIVADSAKRLNKKAPVGTIASVLEKTLSRAPISNDFEESKVVEELHFNIPAKIDSFEEGYLGINFNSSNMGFIQIGQFSGNSKYSIYWSTGGMPQAIAAYDTDGNLVSTDEAQITSLLDYIASGSCTYRVLTGSEVVDKFIFGAEQPSFTTRLFVRNTSGWEQYNEIVDGSVTSEKLADKAVTLDKLSEDISTVIEGCPIAVESVDNLPSNAKIGTIASVLETTVEEVTSGGTPHNGLRLKQVEVRDTVYMSMPPNMAFILTAKDGTTIEIRSRASGPDFTLYFLDQNKNEYTLAAFSLQNSTVEKNTENIDTLNQLLQSNKYYCRDEYFNQSEAQGISSYFKTLVHEKEVYTTKVYVKNTAGWEEYDKATKDKVATLESKVAELEAKIQELLQN